MQARYAVTKLAHFTNDQRVQDLAHGDPLHYFPTGKHFTHAPNDVGGTTAIARNDWCKNANIRLYRSPTIDHRYQHRWYLNTKSNFNYKIKEFIPDDHVHLPLQLLQEFPWWVETNQHNENLKALTTNWGVEGSRKNISVWERFQVKLWHDVILQAMELSQH